MKINDNVNSCVLANNINEEFLKQYSEYNMISEVLPFHELLEKIENYLSKVIVFNDVLRSYKEREIEKLLNLMKLRNIHFINITSDIEEALFCDYIYVFDNNSLIMDGSKEAILKEEKILKRLGFGLPFVVDLSTQLNYYGILSKVYYDEESLVKYLWS